MVVYGHTPVPEPEWLNRTINIDTGCVFGGRLTALRYPEQELVSVAVARRLRGTGEAVPGRGGAARALTSQQREDELLDIEDVLGKRLISTRLCPQGHDPRRERDRRAGGDGPVRGQPEVARLPAATMFAV